jgi:HYR domain
MRTSIAVLLSGLVLLAPRGLDAQPLDACYRHTFLYDKPDEATPGWNQEAQGLTHDSNYWYVVQNVEACVVPAGESLCDFETPQGCVVPSLLCPPNEASCANLRPGKLWKLHVTHDLSEQAEGDGAKVATVSQEICSAGFSHVGAPTHYTHNGTGFVLVPLEGAGPAVAAFRADTLESLGWVALSGQSSASWVAVDRYGLLWSGSHNTPALTRYRVAWETLRLTGQLSLTRLDDVPMQDEAGQPLSLATYEQGGAFADNAELPFPLLYLVNGNEADDCDCGVHVLEIKDSTTGESCGLGSSACTARRVDRSANGDPPFSYAYNPGPVTFEEPEGVTFWDLDADTRSPGIGGQVHVVLLDNELDGFVEDDVYVKHYRLETDSVAPAITCPQPIVVECTGNGGINRTDAQLEPFFASVSATDRCDQNVSITHTAPSFLPLGTTTVGFTATDDFRNASSCSATVKVQDTLMPTLAVRLNRDVLWMPNHELVSITATVNVTDRCDPNATFVLTSITSNEPDEGLGDGDKPRDIQGAAFGTPDTSFLLRAERSGMGAGRVYTIVYTASDATGNTATATAVVRVPHAQ